MEATLEELDHQERAALQSSYRSDLERQLALLEQDAALEREDDEAYLVALDRYDAADVAYYDALDALIAVQQQQQVLLRAHVGELRACLRGAL